jgi:hypothetical protein
MSYPQTRISVGEVTRARTADAWRGLLEAYTNDPTLGTLRSLDTTKPRTQAVATALEGYFVAEDDVAAATAELFATAILPAINSGDGIYTIGATTGTDNIGVKVQAAAAAASLGEEIRLPSDIVDPRGDVVFEANVYLDDDSADQYFIGLAVNAAVVLASGLIGAAQSVLGFLRTDGGDLKFVARNDNAGGTAVEYSATIVAAADLATAGWHSLCFRHNKDNTVQVYFDGERVRTDTSSAPINVTTTALPEVAVVRTISTSRGATGDLAAVLIPIRRFEAYVQE